MMRRREFITLLGGAAAWPLAARAQQPAMPVIGFLNSASPGAYASNVAAFLQGLKEAGYVDGRNVAIEYRWAEGRYDRLPAMAADYRRPVAVIAATSTPAALAAQKETTVMPIVFTTSSDPVTSWSRRQPEPPGRQFHRGDPVERGGGAEAGGVAARGGPRGDAHRLARQPGQPQCRDGGQRPAGCGACPRTAQSCPPCKQRARNRERLRDPERVACRRLVIGSDVFFDTRAEQLGALAVRHAVPAIYHNREFVAAGGLMSYAGSITDSYRLAGLYTGRILKGEKPVELPVQQATNVELIINLKTAKALGLKVPARLLARADEVIE